MLCLGTKPRSNNGEPPSIPNPESAEDLQAKLQVSRGNIIDHLRQRVRIEAAQNVKDKADVAVDEDEEVLEDKDSDNGEFDDETKNLESFSTSWKGGQQVEALLQDPVSGKSAFSSDDIKYVLRYSVFTRLLTKCTCCSIRRERNRMHAKLTRDRKKLFTSRMQQTIQALERHNQMLKNKLQAMAPGSSGSTSNSAISAMDSSTPSDSTGMTTSMSSSSGSMNGSANNSGGTTPAASSSSRLQGSVASGTSAGITVPANSFSELPSGVIPVFPVKTGPNGVVSWMPTAALAWAAVAPPSANSSNNSATPTLYPIVTTVDGTLTGLPPISASLAQSFYQFQRNYFNAQNGNPTDGDSGDTSDGNRSNSNLAPAKDHP